MSSPVLVLGGGDPISAREFAAFPRLNTVVVADSGIDRANEVGISPTIAVGDFDSVTAQGFLLAEAEGVEIHRFPAAKSETDLELALLHVLGLEAEQLTVAAIGGGRLDHFLANMLLLGDERFASMEIEALVDNYRVTVLRGQRTLAGPVGSILSLLPIGGPAEAISTSGLQYPLDDETLTASSPRGMSNVLTAPLAVVNVGVGVILAFQELPS